MADSKHGKRLIREGEPSEKTRTGLDVPIPKRSEFIRNLRKVSKTEDSETKGRPKQ